MAWHLILPTGFLRFNNMANFGESFAKTFNQQLPQGVAMGARGAERAQVQRLALDRQRQMASTVDGLFASLNDDQVNQSAETEKRIGGFRGLEMMDLLSKAHPGAKKAILSATMSTIEMESGKPASDIFKKWIGSAKPDEVRAHLDFIADQAENDESFNKETLDQLMTDPGAFTSVLVKAQDSMTRDADGNLSYQRPPELPPAQKQLKMQLRSQKKRLMQSQKSLKIADQLEAMMEMPDFPPEYIAKASSFVKAANRRYDSINSEITETNTRLNRLLDKGEDTAIMSLTDPVTDEVTSVMYNKTNNSVTDLQGNSVDTTGKQLRPAGFKPDLTDITTIDQDGNFTSMKGTPQSISDALDRQQNTSDIKFSQEFRDSVTPIISVAINTENAVKTLFSSGSGATGLVGWVANVGNNIQSQWEAANRRFEFSDGSDLDFDSAFKEYSAKFPWLAELAGDNAQLQRSLVTLAYANSKIMDSSGRISDKDFDNQMRALGATGGDAKKMRDLLVQNYKEKRNEIRGRRALLSPTQREKVSDIDVDNVLREAGIDVDFMEAISNPEKTIKNAQLALEKFPEKEAQIKSKLAELGLSLPEQQ